MSTLSQFAGNRAVRSLVNGPAFINISGSPEGNFTSVLSGAMTAGTLKTILSISGGGELDIWLTRWNSGAAKTMRTKITADGVTVFDNTTASVSQGISVVVGNIVSGTTTSIISGAPVSFNASLLVEVASSASETDGINLRYAYRVK